jgi:epoxide hydrolase-like predicted phosphatase
MFLPMRGLLVDFGGVLTSNVFDSFAAFCRDRGVDADLVKNLFRADEEARDLLVRLETGALDERGFETGFATKLGIDPDGLIDALFGHVHPDEAMIAAVAAARAAGLTTGLLSNSWGRATDYDTLGDIFDARVISSAEGMRKPDPRIYELAAQRMGLPAAEIAFVDDLPFNLKPARAQGMTTIHHTDAATTIAELERVFGTALHGESEPG